MANVTNEALFFYCFGLFAYSSIQVLNRSFYALRDTLTPVIVAAITIGCNIYLSINLSAGPMGYKGLALAYSLAGILSLVLLLAILRLKVGKLGGNKILLSLTISIGASLLMYGVVRQVMNYLLATLGLAFKLNLLISVSTGIMLGALLYAVIIYLFKLEESELVLNMIRKRLPGQAKFQ
jgi:putative peptidoglycan lipid II flippase